jgi:hypothetical protein
MNIAAVVKLISKRLYESSSHFSAAMFEASRKYPRRILPVINPWLDIVNILYKPEKFMLMDLDNLEIIP